jgi:hypothetical protein
MSLMHIMNMKRISNRRLVNFAIRNPVSHHCKAKEMMDKIISDAKDKALGRTPREKNENV